MYDDMTFYLSPVTCYNMYDDVVSLTGWRNGAVERHLIWTGVTLLLVRLLAFR